MWQAVQRRDGGPTPLNDVFCSTCGLSPPWLSPLGTFFSTRGAISPQAAWCLGAGTCGPSSHSTVTALTGDRSFDSQRGAVIATELKNNSYKLARWTCCACWPDPEHFSSLGEIPAQEP